MSIGVLRGGLGLAGFFVATITENLGAFRYVTHLAHSLAS
ncbi:hypothetical protein BN1232_02764 [Mycobacterium lentiflavum]|uniref:Uncharacterized protein n=1 Tax=Mycobacterium lentiflavum TaxID=141349 RepID=A0A0E4CND5_MYCLN|nr:hypothetical protein BN1232_02764 [Mycobacterium lentiflavum]